MIHEQWCSKPKGFFPTQGPKALNFSEASLVTAATPFPLVSSCSSTRFSCRNWPKAPPVNFFGSISVAVASAMAGDVMWLSVADRSESLQKIGGNSQAEWLNEFKAVFCSFFVAKKMGPKPCGHSHRPKAPHLQLWKPYEPQPHFFSELFTGR